MDYFTKGLEAIPMTDQEASTLSEAIVEILIPVLEFKLYFPQSGPEFHFDFLHRISQIFWYTANMNNTLTSPIWMPG